MDVGKMGSGGNGRNGRRRMWLECNVLKKKKTNAYEADTNIITLV